MSNIRVGTITVNGDCLREEEHAVQLSVTQSIVNGAAVVSFTTVDWGNSAMYDSTNKRIKLTKAGIYVICAYNKRVGTGTPTTNAYIFVERYNSSGIRQAFKIDRQKPKSITQGQKLTFINKCAINDYFVVSITNNHGATVSYDIRISAVRLSD